MLLYHRKPTLPAALYFVFWALYFQIHPLLTLSKPLCKPVLADMSLRVHQHFRPGVGIWRPGQSMCWPSSSNCSMQVLYSTLIHLWAREGTCAGLSKDWNCVLRQIRNATVWISSFALFSVIDSTARSIFLISTSLIVTPPPKSLLRFPWVLREGPEKCHCKVPRALVIEFNHLSTRSLPFLIQWLLFLPSLRCFWSEPSPLWMSAFGHGATAAMH